VLDLVQMPAIDAAFPPKNPASLHRRLVDEVMILNSFHAVKHGATKILHPVPVCDNECTQPSDGTCDGW
jgi:hypothetical protein